MPLTENEKPASPDVQTLIPVAVNTLCPAELDFDLYIQRDPDEPALLYRERSHPLEAADLERLTARGVQTLYIASDDHSAYQHYIHEEVICNEQVPPTKRYQVLKAANRAVFEQIFRHGTLEKMVEFSGEMGTQMTDIICGQDLVLPDLFALMEHDYYTYTHATNVCTYSLLLASSLGSYAREDQYRIATGALLHDIGKREIQLSLLNKPGALTDQQREIIQQHPRIGFERLCLRGDLTWGELMMIYQHHERLNGQGYPVGLEEDDIHPWARICSIADVFHAMTSERPYHKARPFEVALDFIRQRGGTDFDEAMVTCWIETI